MVTMVLGSFTLGLSIGLIITYYLIKKGDQEWKSVVIRIQSTHEQEIQKINEDWEKFTCKISGIKAADGDNLGEVDKWWTSQLFM